MLLFGIGLCADRRAADRDRDARRQPRRQRDRLGRQQRDRACRGLLGIAVVGVAVAGRSGRELGLDGFRIGMAVTAALLAAGGVVGFLGIRNPARVASSEAPLVSSAR